MYPFRKCIISECVLCECACYLNVHPARIGIVALYMSVHVMYIVCALIQKLCTL